MNPDILTRLQSALAGRYDVKRELARGGMGKVFEARDEKHRRSVAIKVLDPELAAAIGPARFRAEIETAARLSHPHIAPLFDSGEADGLLYYVMPLLTGESLRQRLQRERQLPIEDTIRIAGEISGALQYAHEQGLVHRDVKPENIVLTGGHALILDFGIARTSDTPAGPETHTLATIGTPTYMSPEQTAGGALDARSDQYSLACVVYEMLTGQPPFSAPSADSMLLQHRTLDPRPVTALRPTTPVYVAHALTRGLAKSPADRHPTMAAFAEAISSSATPSGRGTPGAQPGGRVMLAVLPLENRSADPEQEYFTDGMTEELIAHLGKVQPKSLGVIARTSAMRYKKTPKSIEEVGRELGVEYVVEGSVRRAGDRVRITTQLIQVADQSQLWSQTYDRRMADVFDLQDEVASAVAKALEVELVSSRIRPQAESEPASSEAYDAYLKGRYHWNRRTPEGLRLAIRWFEKAIELDPEFARAYAGLADVYNVQVTYFMVEANEVYPIALRAAKRAVDLAPQLAEAHASYGSMLTHAGHMAEAKPEYDRALELDPNYVPNLYWRAVYEASEGRFDEAFAIVRRAQQLDPLSVTVEIVYANISWFSRRGPEAIQHYQRALELEPKFPWVRLRLTLCLAAFGRLDEALETVNALESAMPGTLEAVSLRAYVLGRLGRREEAEAMIRELLRRAEREYVAWELFAYAYLGVDDRDALYRVLSAASNVGLIGRLFLKYDASYDPLRDDPRFKDILPARPGEREALRSN